MPLTATPRRYLMCRPTFFDVSYRINPWMDPAAGCDPKLALKQWERLRRTLLDLGHTVEEIEPVEGLPDMVFAANGATVIDGLALAARFRDAERADEAAAYAAWLEQAGLPVLPAAAVNEGEGDLLLAGDVILAGAGFRTEPAAHAEAQEAFGRQVVTLRLVDPRYYHLDTALCVLGPDNVAYLPQAFSPGSVAVLRRMFPDAIVADPADAAVLGLNAVSDGRHVVLPEHAVGLAARLDAAGYDTIGIDVSELSKAGGGPKCCTLEVRDD